MSKIKFVKAMLGFLSILGLLVACNPAPEDIEGIVQTVDPGLIRPVLFKPTDVDWPDGAYVEITEIWVSPDGFLPAEDQMGAGMQPFPKSGKTPHRRSILSASQVVYFYVDEDGAVEAFEQAEGRFRLGLGSHPESVDFELLMNHALMGCRQSWSSDIGDYHTCELLAQHGSFLTVVHMSVDGTIVEFEDWEDLINAIQDRLIVQVEQQSSE